MVGWCIEDHKGHRCIDYTGGQEARRLGWGEERRGIFSYLILEVDPL
jgi:hypothetical protein